jgi:hypothetical protein
VAERFLKGKEEEKCTKKQINIIITGKKKAGALIIPKKAP